MEIVQILTGDGLFIYLCIVCGREFIIPVEV